MRESTVAVNAYRKACGELNDIFEKRVFDAETLKIMAAMSKVISDYTKLYGTEVHEEVLKYTIIKNLDTIRDEVVDLLPEYASMKALKGKVKK